MEIPDLPTFEGYPNRDSISYIDTYGFGPQVKDMFRGTLRNQGHCRLYTGLIELGLLEDEPKQSFEGQTYLGLMEQLYGKPVQESISAKLGVKAEDSPLQAMEYISLFQDRPIEIASGSLMDLLADRMAKDLDYKPGERDMLLMRHDITFTYPDSQRKECITAIMVDYGIPNGDSSMARTVSLPAAIGVRMLLEGQIQQRGVHTPVVPGIYDPVLAELEQMGISFTETRCSL